MPRTVAHVTAAKGFADALFCGNPVPRITGIVVATVTIIGDNGIIDHIVARQGATDQLGVIEDAGVKHGHHHRIRPGRHIPCPG